MDQITVEINEINLKGHSVNPRIGQLTLDRFESRNKEFFRYYDVLSCLNCGRIFTMFNRDNDGKLTLQIAACEITNEPITTSLNVESGKIIINDVLLLHIPGTDLDDPDYNSFHGKKEFAEQASKYGVAQGYVGNSSPQVFFNASKNHLIITSSQESEDDEFVSYRPDYEYVGTICTDTWSYEIMDSHSYDIEPESNKTDASDTLIEFEIPNGEWVFTHYASKPEFRESVDYEKEILYAEAVLKGVLNDE